MKTFSILAGLILICLSVTSRGTQTAQGTFFCLSLKFQQGQGSFDETLDLTTISGAPNGELAVWYSVYTHRCGFMLDLSGFPITGTLYLDLPPNADVNNNGFDDSFELSQAVSGASYGEYEWSNGFGGGLVTASWNRGAGSQNGICVLRLVDDAFGDLGNFRHDFEVLAYQGALRYTPGSNTVSGDLSLTNAADALAGLVSFTKSVTNPTNELTLAAGVWTNASLALLTHPGGTFYRDPSWPTNYYGMIGFNDGDLGTGAPDYRWWVLSIDDLNDADGDGIPDFSDAPPEVLPRRPALTLTRGLTNLLLTISGEAGRLHQVLETTTLSPATWLTNLSLTLTNDPQTVMLPLPPGATRFWRVTAY